jgi:hypothetical protein
MITWKSRTWPNIICFAFYKIMRVSYASAYYYFLPYVALYGSFLGYFAS